MAAGGHRPSVPVLFTGPETIIDKDLKRTEKRQSLELDDCLIGATAFVTGAVLATENEKHYPMKDVKKIAVKRQQAG